MGTRGLGAVVGAAVLAAIVMLASDRTSETSEAGALPAPAPTVATTTTVPTISPLTGLPPADPSRLSRPALSVKVDNAPEARPQAGLDAADLVYEEVVEGGVVRFMAVFHSQDAPRVGPIRSVRPVDAKLLAPLGGLVAYSGGTPKFVATLRKAPVEDVGADRAGDAYYRRRGRPSPHNLFASTEDLYDSARRTRPAPRPQFAWLGAGEAFAPSGWQPATHVRVVMGARTTADWTWAPRVGEWQRSTNGTQHRLDGGTNLSVDNVAIQFVPFRFLNDRDQSGARVPDSDVVGSGEAWVLSQGRIVRGRWSKPSTTAVTTFTDAAGKPLLLTPGRTWVSLAPRGVQTLVEPAPAPPPRRTPTR